MGMDFAKNLIIKESLEKAPQEQKVSSLAVLSYPPSSQANFPNSLQSLLSQNEDLFARLKTTTQRLIQFEGELEARSEENQRLIKNQNVFKEQLLIWKEKELLWLEKQEVANQKIAQLDAKVSGFNRLQIEIQRYRKYHEKVKKQIRPYLQQLKEYSRGLLAEIKELNRELTNKKQELHRSNELIAARDNELRLRAQIHQSSIENLNEKLSEKLGEKLRHRQEKEKIKNF